MRTLAFFLCLAAMPLLLCGVVSPAGADVLPVQPPPGVAGKTRPPALSTDHARNYALQVHRAAREISREYVQPVPIERLAAHAILALYAATQTPLPEYLQGDPDKLFLGKDLTEELARARLALGNPSVISFQFRRDVRLSIQAMLTTLDPYSMYLSDEETLRASQRGTGTVGLLLEERNPGNPCVVQNVQPGGPAQQAGILPGDELLAINGKPVPEQRPARLVMQDMGGSPESTVELTVRSLYEETPRKVLVTRAFLREETVLGHRRQFNGSSVTWEHLLGTREKIALVRIGSILSEDAISGHSSTADQLGALLASLQQEGLTGLVLDLRDCPGGSMDGALEVASLFIPDGVIASTKHRREENLRPPYRAQRMENGLYRTPLVVLVGPNTMGGGELIAAALQDHGRAVVVGQRTRGKASIQETKTLDPNYSSYHQVRLTTGYFLRPNGGNLNRFADSKPNDEWGVHPDADYEVRLAPVMLRQVRIWRLQQDLNNPDLTAGLPPDRLENDPVLYAGVQCLLLKKK